MQESIYVVPCFVPFRRLPKGTGYCARHDGENGHASRHSDLELPVAGGSESFARVRASRSRRADNRIARGTTNVSVNE